MFRDVAFTLFRSGRDASFTPSRPGTEKNQIDDHEAYFKTLEAIDEFNDASRTAEEHHPGAGTLCMTKTGRLVGFSLMHKDELIHNALFVKQD